MKEEKKLYSVKEVCEKYGITRKTLFYYDREGLLKPGVRKGLQNFKYYSAKDLDKLEKIIEFRNAGVPIATLKTILGNMEDHRKIIGLLEETKFSLIIHCKEVKKELINIDVLINRYKHINQED